MPYLQWIGKEKIINHHQDVPYKILNHKYGFSKELGEISKKVNTGNKIIKGDNLAALKALLPEYEGRVNCIYIDPPYNTGNEGWVYNDNVNHPKIKKWLGEIVGKESEDLSRHDKWLCMMYPRLKLLHKLLSNDGVIFISIDDNELANLRLIMDEIFGENNFITNFIWEKKKKPAFLSNQLGVITEYVISYGKNTKLVKPFTIEGFKTTEGKKYPFNNSGNGLSILIFPPKSVKFNISDAFIEPQDMSEGNIKTRLINKLQISDGYNVNEFQLEGEWRYSQNKLNEIVNNGEEIIISKLPFRPNHVKKGGESKKIHNFLSYRTYEIETNEDASSEIQKIFGNKSFDFSKPKSLINFLVETITDKDSIILDSFAGSGTTGHAVMKLNEQDGGNRKFVLIELEDYAETVTAERNKRVINGYGSEVGINSGFDFYELGGDLFLDSEQKILNTNVSVLELRKYIYYTETGDLLDEKEYVNKYYLNSKFDTSYYFYYEENDITILDEKFLSKIQEKSSYYLIYADICNVSDELMRKNNIIFKKIPRDITKI